MICSSGPWKHSHELVSDEINWLGATLKNALNFSYFWDRIKAILLRCLVRNHPSIWKNNLSQEHFCELLTERRTRTTTSSIYFKAIAWAADWTRKFPKNLKGTEVPCHLCCAVKSQMCLIEQKSVQTWGCEGSFKSSGKDFQPLKDASTLT